jgi:hypothetical protein
MKYSITFWQCTLGLCLFMMVFSSHEKAYASSMPFDQVDEPANILLSRAIGELENNFKGSFL